MVGPAYDAAGQLILTRGRGGKIDGRGPSRLDRLLDAQGRDVQPVLHVGGGDIEFHSLSGLNPYDRRLDRVFFHHHGDLRINVRLFVLASFGNKEETQ